MSEDYERYDLYIHIEPVGPDVGLLRLVAYNPAQGKAKAEEEFRYYLHHETLRQLSERIQKYLRNPFASS